MKKGFTLIELLAVIVILAIIALIATPIVLNIINDTEDSALIRSSEFYISALKNAIMKKNLELNGTLNPKVCEVIQNGNVICDGVEIEIDVDGEVPDGGTIELERGKTINALLIYGDLKVTTYKNELIVINPEPCKLISGKENEKGSKYECEVKPGTKHNFYVISKSADLSTNLIMERNICEDGSYATSSNKCTIAYNASGDALNVGPVTAMEYLNNATSSWINIENQNTTYNDEGGHFTNFEITGKARLPYYWEVTAIGCSRDSNSCPAWLIDFVNDSGVQENIISGINGFHIFSTHSANSKISWFILSRGALSEYWVEYDVEYGVRPVINVKM